MYLVHVEAEGRRDSKYIEAVDTESAARKAAPGWRSGCSVTKDLTGSDIYGDYDRYILRSQGFVAAVRVYLSETKA